MQFIYKNIFIGKHDHFNYYFNILYWFVKLFKDIFKWLYSVSLFAENKTLFGLSFISPILKYIFISISAISAFKRNFRGQIPLLIIMVILLLIESFFELPMHLLCPINKIYLHTNYYRVYDKKTSSSTNINLEGIECIVLFGFLLWYFCFGKFHYSAVVLIILVIPLVCFFIGAKVFYCCYESLPEDKSEAKDKEVKELDSNSNHNCSNEDRYHQITQTVDKHRVMPYL